MTIHTLTTVPVPPRPDIYGEADHRIANSLQTISSLVRIRARNFENADPKVFLSEVADRIETLGKLHRLLSHSPSGAIVLADYLQEICDRLTSALGDSKVDIAFVCSPRIAVASRVAMSLGLIVAELISNSLKYAHPTGLPVAINLSCIAERHNAVRLAYEDDGVGFPENFNFAGDGHLGMRFIASLGESLRCTPRWRSDPLGVRFEIEVPLTS